MDYHKVWHRHQRRMIHNYLFFSSFVIRSAIQFVLKLGFPAKLKTSCPTIPSLLVSEPACDWLKDERHLIRVFRFVVFSGGSPTLPIMTATIDPKQETSLQHMPQNEHLQLLLFQLAGFSCCSCFAL